MSKDNLGEAIQGVDILLHRPTSMRHIGIRLKMRVGLEQLRGTTRTRTEWRTLRRTVQWKRCKRAQEPARHQLAVETAKYTLNNINNTLIVGGYTKHSN